MKTITVDDETWKRLSEIKINNKDLDTLDKVIVYLLELYPKYQR